MWAAACTPDEPAAGSPYAVVDGEPPDAEPDAAVDAAPPDAALPDAAIDPSAGRFVADVPRVQLTSIGEGAGRRVIGVTAAYEAEGTVFVFDAAEGRVEHVGPAEPGATVVWSDAAGAFGLVAAPPLGSWVGHWDADAGEVRPLAGVPAGATVVGLDDGTALVVDAETQTLRRFDLRTGAPRAPHCCGPIEQLQAGEGTGHLTLALREGSRSTVLYAWPSGRGVHRVGELGDEGFAVGNAGVTSYFMGPEGPRRWNLLTQQGAPLDDEAGARRWRVLSPRYVQWTSADGQVRVHDTRLDRRVVDAPAVVPITEPDGDLLTYAIRGAAGPVAVVIADGEASEVPIFPQSDPIFSPSQRSIGWFDGAHTEVRVWSRRQGEVLTARTLEAARLWPLGEGASWVLGEGFPSRARTLSVIDTSGGRIIGLDAPLAPDQRDGACGWIGRHDPPTLTYLTPPDDEGAQRLVWWRAEAPTEVRIEGIRSCEGLELSRDGERGLLRADGRLWAFTAEGARELTPDDAEAPWSYATTDELEEVWVMKTDADGRFARTTHVWRADAAEPIELDQRVLVDSLSPRGDRMYYRTFEDACMSGCRGRLWRLDDGPTLIRPAVTEFYGVHHGWAFVYDRGDAQRPAGVYAVPTRPGAP